MGRSSAREREDRAAQREDKIQREGIEARQFLVTQRHWFAEIGVSVRAMGTWGVRFEVGDNVIIDNGNVTFVRMAQRVLKSGEQVNVRLTELVQDQYQTLDLGTTNERAAEAAREAPETALAAVVAGAVRANGTATGTAQGQKTAAHVHGESAGTARGEPVTADQIESAGTAQRVPVTADQIVLTGTAQAVTVAQVREKETRTQRKRRMKRDSRLATEQPPSHEEDRAQAMQVLLDRARAMQVQAQQPPPCRSHEVEAAAQVVSAVREDQARAVQVLHEVEEGAGAEASAEQASEAAGSAQSEPGTAALTQEEAAGSAQSEPGTAAQQQEEAAGSAQSEPGTAALTQAQAATATAQAVTAAQAEAQAQAQAATATAQAVTAAQAQVEAPGSAVAQAEAQAQAQAATATAQAVTAAQAEAQAQAQAATATAQAVTAAQAEATAQAQAVTAAQAQVEAPGSAEAQAQTEAQAVQATAQGQVAEGYEELMAAVKAAEELVEEHRWREEWDFELVVSFESRSLEKELGENFGGVSK